MMMGRHYCIWLLGAITLRDANKKLDGKNRPPNLERESCKQQLLKASRCSKSPPEDDRHHDGGGGPDRHHGLPGRAKPPGGVWQDNTPSHKAGEVVLATTHPEIYRHMAHANTIAFSASIITIFLVTTWLPATHFFFMASAMYAMWVALTAITISFGVAMAVVTPGKRGYLVVVAVGLVAANGFGLLSSYVAERKLHLSGGGRRSSPKILLLIVSYYVVSIGSFSSWRPEGF
ncbi:uncharacterized protein LOC121782184 [Salvia splendens]|uniref:uncharacterized protein LOC121782184 n=1 Tax=Salvia splendens TaxID=180675 RepID=UPI001C260843|nr:uncharacterized protein LOC121782184 [Salvia splendens]